MTQQSSEHLLDHDRHAVALRVVDAVLHAAQHGAHPGFFDCRQRLPPGTLILTAQPFPFRQPGRTGFADLTSALDAEAKADIKSVVLQADDKQCLQLNDDIITHSMWVRLDAIYLKCTGYPASAVITHTFLSFLRSQGMSSGLTVEQSPGAAPRSRIGFDFLETNN